MNAPNILVFDSGIGGLSVVQTIRKRIPHCSISYLADNEKFPYGTLTAAELLARVIYLLDKHLKVNPVDIIVIACNTASTLVLDALRQTTSTPIVGVVPAVKPAAQLSKTGHIGLLATPATIARDYTNQLIDNFAPSANIHRIGSQALVELAEQLDVSSEQRQTVIRKELAPWVNTGLINSIDVIVLACTHFPLLKGDIQNTLTTGVTLIDSGDAIARRIEQLLADITVSSTRQDDIAIFTDLNAVKPSTRAFLSQFSLSKVIAFKDE